MEEKQLLKTYRQKPVSVKAFRWEPKLGAVGGVKARPKQHVMNPDEFYILDRFRKDIILKDPCWITTKNDGSNDVVPDGQFLELWEEVDESPRTAAGPGNTQGLASAVQPEDKDLEPEKKPEKPTPDEEEKPSVLKNVEAGTKPRKPGRPRKDEA